jgi:seryl-tRNA synthetase
MLPREVYRSDPDRVRTMLADRHTEAPLDRLLEVDVEWRRVLARVEELKARRNTGSKEVGALFREGRKDEAEALKGSMGAIGDEIKDLEGRANTLEDEMKGLELTIPNLFHDTVPVGADESENREERRWGEPSTFDFEAQAHWDLGPALGILDFDAAAAIAGARFVVLRGPMRTRCSGRCSPSSCSIMHTARARLHGTSDVPYMVNARSMQGTGQLPKFKPPICSRSRRAPAISSSPPPRCR